MGSGVPGVAGDGSQVKAPHQQGVKAGRSPFQTHVHVDVLTGHTSQFHEKMSHVLMLPVRAG